MAEVLVYIFIVFPIIAVIAIVTFGMVLLVGAGIVALVAMMFGDKV